MESVQLEWIRGKFFTANLKLSRSRTLSKSSISFRSRQKDIPGDKMERCGRVVGSPGLLTSLSLHACGV